jgi:hypothetical protein
VASTAADDKDLLRVTTHLRSALKGLTGRLRVVDAFVLAGFDHPTYYRAKLIVRAMRKLGWKRGRLRFDGAPTYAYARGSGLERETILDVQRDEALPGKFLVVRREP